MRFTWAIALGFGATAAVTGVARADKTDSGPSTISPDATSSFTNEAERGGNPQECDPGEEPDIIIGDLQDQVRWGHVGDITAYSVARYACNSGTCWVNWIDNTNQHPVVGQNMYRLKTVDGSARCEQIGMSWLKHEFFALSSNLCFTDCQSTTGEHLGVHCADASNTSLMGQQSNLGPRSQVNPYTGEFPYPWSAPDPPPTIGRRLQVHDADLQPALNAGALYFVEDQFIAADDALAGNGNNNATYRRVNVGPAPFNLSFVSGFPAQDEQAAIRAWKDHGLGPNVPDPAVEERDIQVPGDGLFILAAKATDLGTGFWHYEYAIQNLNSHRSARSFGVALPVGSTVQNAGFHDVDYHSGEPYDLTDWTITISTTSITWSTQSFDENENANALRWGTLCNFRFDSDTPPGDGTVTLGLFRPGVPDAITASAVVPVEPQECDPGESPDIILGEIQDQQRWGIADGITAYSIGAYPCNAGTCWLNYFTDTNQHPVVGQNMYRLKTTDGAARFEHIGMSWLKHTFFALSNNVCFSDCQSTNGEHLGVHCSDPYNSGLMGQQSNLGPRSQVNPSTGDFPFPFSGPPPAPTIGRRLQVHDADLDPALNSGAVYFVEGHYVTPDDALAGNGNNNASYRRVNVGPAPNFNLSFVSGFSTQREQAAIRAWQDHGLGPNMPDPAVEERDIQVPGDGLYVLAAKATDLGTGFWHYEYAIQNLNSHRSARSFTVPFALGSTIQNAGFHDVDYHSGEPYDLTDWTVTINTSSITWSTQSFDENENANALRWGTLYNFRFDANVAPVQNVVTLGLFRPGAPGEVAAMAPAPPTGPLDCNTNGIADPTDIAEGASQDCDTNGTPDECQPESEDCNGDGTPDGCQLAGHDCNANGTLDNCEDCNHNGLADACDLAGDTAADCDANGVPDECQTDCDSNGIPDACDPGVVVFQDNFETDRGWMVQSDSPVAGVWERADPQQTVYNAAVVQPEFDNPAGSGTLCFVTDARGTITSSYDVDHGPTRLISPTLDLSAGAAVLEYAYWFHTVLGMPDAMLLEASNDGGTTWVPMYNHDDSAGVWRSQRLVVDNFITRTAIMKFRFSISDPANDSYTEGLIDDVVVSVAECADSPAATVSGAISRRSCDLALIPGRASEPRQGGITEVRIAFDVRPGGPGPDPVALEQATCAAPAFAAYSGASARAAGVVGDDLVLIFNPALENGRTYRISIGPAVTAITGQTVEVRGLLGDVTGDGWVNAADRSAVVGVWTGPGFTCGTDLSSDGSTNAADRSAVIGAWTGTENCAP